ncbi:MAG: malto-oligosyltrehalose synthase, partial [Vicinamibacteria bacterium]
HREYVERLGGYMLKAVREAKLRTSWLEPDPAYEAALSDFVSKLLEPRSSLRFLDDFGRFESGVRKAGLLNALSQLVLKGTMPGIPDFYQGSEIWELHLVDPDNRGPVNFELRRSLLRGVLEEASEDGCAAFVDRAIQSLEDGRLKLYLTRKLLELRSTRPPLFERGEYAPLGAEGPWSENVVAFTRFLPEDHVVVAVGRFFAKLPEPALGSAWENTELRGLPGAPSTYRDVLTGRRTESRLSPRGRELPLTEIFHHAPFAILEPKASSK